MIKDYYADTWFEISDAGNVGDRLIVRIKGIDDVIVNVTLNEVGDVSAFSNKVVVDLNNNLQFSSKYTADKIVDNAIIYILSKYNGEKGESI